MPIVSIPEKNLEIDFPNDMSAEEIEQVIRRDIYQFEESAPTVPSHLPTDIPKQLAPAHGPPPKPLAESMARFGPQPLITQPEPEALEVIPAVASQLAAAPVAGFAGAAKLLPERGIGEDAVDITEPITLDPRTMDERLDEAQAELERVTGALTYQPRTEEGRQMTEALNIPFQKLHEIGDKAGAATLKGTGSPILAALAASSIESLPILLPLFRKPARFAAVKTAQPFKTQLTKIKNSTWWRTRTIKEKGLVTQKIANGYRALEIDPTTGRPSKQVVARFESAMVKMFGKRASAFKQSLERRGLSEADFAPEVCQRPILRPKQRQRNQRPR
jgi:hypothetical protein